MCDKSLGEVERRILADIEHHGWHVIQVRDGRPSPFVYSIGLQQKLSHPELIIFGLDAKLMHRLLSLIVSEIRNGRPFEDAGLYDGIIDAYALAIRSVNAEWHSEYLGYAMWHRRHLGAIGTLKANQVYWPDRAGKFPWDIGFHPANAKIQPRLDLPPPKP